MQTTLTVTVGRELFRFESFQHWVDDAKICFARSRAETNDGVLSTVCVDARGRLCSCGKQFREAEESNAYPVVVYDVNVDGGS